MKLAIVLIFLFVLVYYDSHLLERQDRQRYKNIFRFSKITWALLSMAFFVVVIPFYLLKRKDFKKTALQTVAGGIQETEGEATPLILMSDAIGIVVKWLFGMIGLSIVLKVIAHLTGLKFDLGALVITGVFSSGLLMVLIFLVTRRYSPKGFFHYIGLIKSKNPLSMVIPVSVALGILFAYLSADMITSRVVQPSTPLSDVFEATQMTPVSVVLIFGFLGLALLVAPLVEELIFRGYFFHVIKKYKNQTLAIYVVSIIFALLHVGQYWGDWIAIGMVTTLGFVLSLLRVWSGTTIASIITHYVYNIGVVILPVFLFSIAQPAYVEYQLKYDQITSERKEELLLKSIQDSPDFVHAHNDLAWLYTEEEKNLDEALDLINNALAVDPTRPAYLDTKAEVLFKMGRFAEAVSIEERLVAEHPQNAYYFEQLEKFKEAARIKED